MIIVGNYNLFAPLLLTPRPCRGGAGVGSAFFARTQYLPCPSIFFLDITDPTPIPSPTRAGKQRILHLSEPHPICRSSHRPPTKKEGRTCLPNYILYVFMSKNFMSFCLKPLCLYVQKSFMSLCLKTLCLYVQSPKVQKSKKSVEQDRRAYRRRVGTLNSVMRDVTCSLPCMARTRNVALPSFSRLPACTVAV